MGTTVFIVGVQQSRSIRNQAQQKGVSIAQGLAATLKTQFVTYNYIALEQSANQVAQDPDIVYVIIHDKEGRVAGYSDKPDAQGKFLKDTVSLKAVSAMQTVVQESVWGPLAIRVVDISVPVFLPGSEYRWGTIRVALSLESMHLQIRQIQWLIIGIGFIALLFGIIISIWAARRVTGPLGHVVNATVQAAQGNVSQSIRVRTGDEVEVLAHNLSVMIQEILAQRQQLELQLSEIKRLQQYTEELLTTMQDGLLSIDIVGNVATVNPSACRMLGVEEGTGKGVSFLTFLKDAEALLGYVQEVLKNPGARRQQEVRVNVGGEMRVILAGSSMLVDESGNLTEIVVNLHDITDLKRLEARVRQSERLAALGTLGAGMAHEIRNPLSAIKTFVQLLPRKLDKPGFLEKFHRTVPRELERINRLIEDLLELAREPKYHFDVVNLQTLLEQNADLFEEDLRSNLIQFHTDFSSPLPEVWADGYQLSKAFQNLFRNAIQAMPAGGELSVKTEWREATAAEQQPSSNHGGWAVVTFKDTGVGIASEDVRQIFNPFFTTKDKGTGLGLAITHKVITEHSGHIEVASHVGKGTSFTIYLPVTKGEMRKSAA